MRAFSCRAVFLLLAHASVACGGSHAPAMAADAVGAAPEMAAEPTRALDSTQKVMEAPADVASEEMSASAEQTEGAVTGSASDSQEEQSEVLELREIHAHLSLKVQDPNAARKKLAELARKHQGHVQQETMRTEGEADVVDVTLRIPVAETDIVLAKVEKLGELLDRRLQVEDISKQYFDTKTRLKSLEATLNRYEEMLAHAKTIEEMLKLEAQIQRVRTEIEQTKGEMRYMRDRGSMSTLHLSLRREREIVDVPEVIPPEPNFFPGVRVGFAQDIWRGNLEDESLTSQGMMDVGLSLGITREFGIDVDLLWDPSRQESGIDGAIVTLGGVVYSEYFGEGARRWFEPYIGWRGGYAHLQNRSEGILGASLGLDIFKNDVLKLSMDHRFSGLVGNKIGPHALYQPSLQLNVGF